ncbi:O-antigen ligase domain-containing protein [Gordonia rubripertincta]|uniref:O-antigen ligase domain-containing protein n=1 Tax=Gordonia rubripertincta TaxID=36822 RepID=A0AAW4G8K6_GORRU|nr:O-antigen ligase family protein [Gordonia rubripertincta]MBM7279493.1 O-antigen ligase domain-containing protein [Gordonia rubripertincta]
MTLMILALALALVFVCGLAYLEPRLGVGLVLIGYAAIPFAAHISFAGVHVCTVLALAVACTRLLIPSEDLPPRSRRLLSAMPLGAIVLVAVFLLGSVASELLKASSPGGAIAFWLNFIVAPVLIFVMCCDLAERYENFYRLLAFGYIAVAVVQSVLAFLVSVGVVSQPYLDDYSKRFWWRIVEESNRQMGTIDHPLDLGLLIASAIPLLALVRRAWVTYFSLVALVVGVLVTQSRIALAGAALGIIFLILKSSMTAMRRAILAVGVVVSYAVFSSLGLFEAISGRIQDDSGSAEARRNAWTVILPDGFRFIPSGVGIQKIKSFVASQYGLQTSPESAFLGFLVGFGVVLTICFFAGLLWIVFARIRANGTISPGLVSFVVVFVSIQLYSSVSSGSTVAAYILWLCVFFAFAYDVRYRAEGSDIVGNRSIEGPSTAVSR